MIVINKSRRRHRISWLGLALLLLGGTQLVFEHLALPNVFTERDGTFDLGMGMEREPDELATKVEEIVIPDLYGPNRPGRLGIRHYCGNGSPTLMAVEAYVRDEHGRVNWSHSVAETWVEDWDTAFAIGFADLNGDGRKELIFADRPCDDSSDLGPLENHDRSQASPLTVLFFRKSQWQFPNPGDVNWRARLASRIAGVQLESRLGPHSAGIILLLLVVLPSIPVMGVLVAWFYFTKVPGGRMWLVMFIVSCLAGMFLASRFELRSGELVAGTCCLWGITLFARKLVVGCPQE